MKTIAALFSDFLHEDQIILRQYRKEIGETVHSDVVVSKLVKASILTHQEKNSINLAQTNVGRMNLLMDMLPKKKAAAFPLFCDAIKFKYPALFELIAKAKQHSIMQQNLGNSWFQFVKYKFMQYTVLYYYKY